MSTDLWEQLAETEVPAPPREFDRDVHERLNKTLLAAHLADLLLKGMFFAIGHFALAVLHVLTFTITGRWYAALPREKENPENENRRDP
jgi:hypothetical protein